MIRVRGFESLLRHAKCLQMVLFGTSSSERDARNVSACRAGNRVSRASAP